MEVCLLVAGARCDSVVMVTGEDASVGAQEEQETVGESSAAYPLHSQAPAPIIPVKHPGDNQGSSALCKFESISQHLLQGGPLLAVTE